MTGEISRTSRFSDDEQEAAIEGGRRSGDRRCYRGTRLEIHTFGPESLRLSAAVAAKTAKWRELSEDC